MYAVEKDHIDILQLLIDNGADIEARTLGGETALVLACRYLNTDTVELLIENGADINAKTSEGQTLLERVKSNEYNSQDSIKAQLDIILILKNQ